MEMGSDQVDSLHDARVGDHRGRRGPCLERTGRQAGSRKGAVWRDIRWADDPSATMHSQPGAGPPSRTREREGGGPPNGPPRFIYSERSRTIFSP